MKPPRRFHALIVTSILAVPLLYPGIGTAETKEEYLARTQWFRDAKFGLFIHWGVYSLIGEGEWIMQVKKIPAAEYELLPPKFNPTKFNAAEWISLAKRAGQRYVVVTSKHHDGFAMYDSKVSAYDIIDRTPYKSDPMKALAEECHRQGLRFGFYHSILDWHHPDYEPVPEWDKAARAGHTPSFDRYLEYMQGMVRELCTHYGELACIWWDGSWDHHNDVDKVKFARINAMIRELQPKIMINNRAHNPEDFDTPEQFIPPTGITNEDGTPKLWENCLTLTTGHGSHQPMAWWGYDKNETQFKSAEFSIRMLVDIVSKGGNLLLNVGPTPEGEIRREEVEVLEAMGKWLLVNGEAIYGTTASPFKFLPFYGKATVRGNTLYVHVFNWPVDRRLRLPGVETKPTTARLLAAKDTPLTMESSDGDLMITLPEKAPDAVATVLAIEFDAPVKVAPFVIRPEKDGTVNLPALYAELRSQHGQRSRLKTYNDNVIVADWSNTKDQVAWPFEITQDGDFEVLLTYSAEKPADGNVCEISVGETKLEATIRPTLEKDDQPKTFVTRPAGRIRVPAGANTLIVRIKQLNPNSELMDLEQVVLKPVN